MTQPASPGVIVYICLNCIPEGNHLPRQWMEGDRHVLVKEVPCSGKIDLQYLFHSLEGGACGVCVTTCPAGECSLSQGNFRAEVRIRTMKRLLEEIGLEPERVTLLKPSCDLSFDQLEKEVRQAVQALCALGDSPFLDPAAGPASSAPDTQ